jgi:hypothetical protein
MKKPVLGCSVNASKAIWKSAHETPQQRCISIQLDFFMVREQNRNFTSSMADPRILILK